MGYEQNVKKGFLKFSDFRKIVDDNPQLFWIELENIGEMFLNPELLQIMEYAYSKGIILSARSGVNLNTATEQVLEGLVKYRFRTIVCAIDGASPETYQVYRVGGNFNNVIKNIQIINRYKKQYKSAFPILRWQFIVFGHNEHELPMARQMAKELDMIFVPKMNWDSSYSPIVDRSMVMAETGWPGITREEYQSHKGVNYMRGVCYSLWHSPRINYDGKILGCCWNIWGEFGGNAFDDGYINSINSEGIEYARNMLSGKAEPSEKIPCSICEHYIRMKQTGNYLTLNELYPPASYFKRLAVAAYRDLGIQRLKIKLENILRRPLH